MLTVDGGLWGGADEDEVLATGFEDRGVLGEVVACSGRVALLFSSVLPGRWSAASPVPALFARRDSQLKLSSRADFGVGRESWACTLDAARLEICSVSSCFATGSAGSVILEAALTAVMALVVGG